MNATQNITNIYNGRGRVWFHCFYNMSKSRTAKYSGYFSGMITISHILMSKQGHHFPSILLAEGWICTAMVCKWGHCFQLLINFILFKSIAIVLHYAGTPDFLLTWVQHAHASNSEICVFDYIYHTYIARDKNLALS